MNIITNPLYMYALMFLVAAVVYEFGWSTFYPDLTSDLLCFIAFTIFIAIFLGYLYGHLSLNDKKNNCLQIVNVNKICIIFLGIFFGMICEAIYSGGFPLFSPGTIIYAEFGIPTFHVIWMALKDFFVLTTYMMYLKNHRKIILLLCILALVLDFFIVNRADFLYLSMAMFIIYVMERRVAIFSVKKSILLAIACLGIFYIFGVLGNYRSVVAFSGEYSNDFILSVGQASNNFKNSIIPGEFFWSYLYISSPLANFQHTIDMNNPDIDYLLSLRDVISVLGYSVVPDFLSKRLMPWIGYDNVQTELLVDNLTVCTMYNQAYLFGGYIGCILQFLFLVLFFFGIKFLCRKNTDLQIISNAVLVVMGGFSIFNNMLVFSGWIGQLLFLIIISHNKFFYRLLFA